MFAEFSMFTSFAAFISFMAFILIVHSIINKVIPPQSFNVCSNANCVGPGLRGTAKLKKLEDGTLVTDMDVLPGYHGGVCWSCNKPTVLMNLNPHGRSTDD